METRSAKRKSNHHNQPNKKKRVVLGELPNSTNLIVPQKTLNPRKPAPGKKNKNPSEDFDGPVVSSVYMHLRSMEMEKKRRPMMDYMVIVQRDITPHMRGILIDWLVEVAEEYKLVPDTLHLAVSYIDRKHEEICPPYVEEFCFITDNSYNKDEVLEMETDILKTLEFDMANPTVKTFLRRFNEIACEKKNASSLQFEFLSNYLAELSLLDCVCLRFLPSLVAASATLLARFIVWPKAYPWTSALQEYSRYKPDELKECVLILHDLYMARREASFDASREKYKQHKFKRVANLPSPPHLPSSLFEVE